MLHWCCPGRHVHVLLAITTVLSLVASQCDVLALCVAVVGVAITHNPSSGFLVIWVLCHWSLCICPFLSPSVGRLGGLSDPPFLFVGPSVLPLG